jgi:hypothetical protein
MDGDQWIVCSVELPPDGAVVRTRISDVYGIKNEQRLVRKGIMWMLPDHATYVYYTPTHWRKK